MNNLLKNILGKNEKTNLEFGTFHHDHEVFWDPVQVRPGDMMNINYKGLLKNSGADTIFLHYGFDSWHTPSTVRMDRKEDGTFRTEINARGNEEINFCFKDSANNWDNNNGYNWNVHLQ